MTLYVIAAIILALIGFGIWAYVSGKKAGGNKVAAEVASVTVDAQQRMAQAAADAPEGKPATIDRLRNGGGL